MYSKQVLAQCNTVCQQYGAQVQPQQYSAKVQVKCQVFGRLVVNISFYE